MRPLPECPHQSNFERTPTRRLVAHWCGRPQDVARDNGVGNWCCLQPACVLALQLSGYVVRCVYRTRPLWANNCSTCLWCTNMINWEQSVAEGDEEEAG